MSTNKLRMLYISPGPVPLPENPKENRFHFLSKHLAGGILSTHWGADDEKTAANLQAVRSIIGDLHYDPYLLFGCGNKFSKIKDTLKFLVDGLRAKDIDVVVSYGAYRTGLTAFLIAKLKGIPFVVELSGNPAGAFRFDSNKLKARLSLWLASFVCRRANGIHSLYPEHTASLGLEDENKIHVFHDFTGLIREAEEVERKPVVLFVGHPWKLKGVDLLIKAFNKIKDRYPEHELRIVGHCDDRSEFEALTGGDPRIAFMPGQKRPEILRMMQEAELFVLPSRTEAMGRVLLEAMSCGLPIVASRVDGIPYYVEDEKYGLLFEVDNFDDLAGKLDRALGDREATQKRAEAAKEKVFADYNEDQYAEAFADMLRKVVYVDAS